MKQLLTLMGMGLFCLLLSSVPANAQVSRKGDQGSTKVILKKDKNESTTTASKRSDPQVSNRSASTQNPTRTDTRTYPDRRQQPTTSTGRGYPKQTNRYPRQGEGRSSNGGYQTQKRGDHDGHHEHDRDGHHDYHKNHDYYKKGGYGKDKHNKHQDHRCGHPGKGKHK